MNHARYTVWCRIAMAQNQQEMPSASQQQLAYNSCWGETNFPQVAFFFFLVFSGHDINVFMTDLTVEYVVTHVQGFSSGILIIFFEKLSEMWRNLD